MEWSGKNCPNVHFELISNNDVFANTDSIVEYFQSLKDSHGTKQLYTGLVFDSHGPSAEFKCHVPCCGGGGYLLSGYTAAALRNVSQSMMLDAHDDTYVGMCLQKVGLGPTSHPGFVSLRLSVPSKQIDPRKPCLYKDLLLVDRFLPVDIFLMWNQVFDPDLKCPDLQKKTKT